MHPSSNSSALSDEQWSRSLWAIMTCLIRMQSISVSKDTGASLEAIMHLFLGNDTEVSCFTCLASKSFLFVNNKGCVSFKAHYVTF